MVLAANLTHPILAQQTVEQILSFKILFANIGCYLNLKNLKNSS
jgi:hypothetical protein